MIRFFINRPATTMIFVLFFVVLGIVAYKDLAIELIPRMDLPVVTVTATYPGATPFEIEKQLINKIEEKVSELSNIKRITSRSYENYGYVFIEFTMDSDSNDKTMEVKDKVESILNDLPPNAETPLVQKFDPLSIPAVQLVLTSTSLNSTELYELADKKLKGQFTNIPGVASVDIEGGQERQINIFVDPLLTKKYYVAITDIINTITGKNINMPGGVIEKDDYGIRFRFVGEFDNIKELSNLDIVTQDSQIIKLHQIATITDSHKKEESKTYFNSKGAVNLSIVKTNEANTVTVANSIKAELDAIKTTLPEGVTLTIAIDNSSHVIHETNDTLINILIGVLLTIIILLVFTGNIRLTFIAATVIPTSLIASLFLIQKSEFSINIMTLIGIAMALGTLIANAIVVIEGVLAELEKGKTPKKAALDGTQSVTAAVFASAGTNLVVFTPIAFVSGMVGPFFKQFGLTVVYATIFSIIISFSLTPMLCGMLLKQKIPNQNKQKQNKLTKLANHTMSFLLKEYKIIYDAILRFPKTVLIATFALLFLSLYLLQYVGSEFFSNSDQDLIKTAIYLPQGSTLDKTEKTVKKIEEFIKTEPNVKSYLSNIGVNGVENAEIDLNLISKDLREQTDLEIIDSLTTKLSIIPDAEIIIKRGHVAGDDYGDITLKVYGEDYDKLISYVDQIKSEMKKSRYFKVITSSFKGLRDEISFVPNEEAIIKHGISPAQVAQVMRASIYGDTSNIYKENGEDYDINVELDDFHMSNSDDFKNILISSKKGLLPITELGKIKKTKSLSSIRHRDSARMIQIDAYLAKSTAGQVMASLDQIFAKINFDKGYGYQWIGNAENQQESNKEIGEAFLLATILTFMILVAILNSFVHPFTIASSIFTSFIGVFLFMFYAGATFNIASMLAMVMLVGLVVNNAILMLDSAMNHLKTTPDIKEALWLGVSDKFRAILMTSIAIVFGVLPQLSSNDNAKVDMSIVLIGGVLASIIFTFVVTPVVFWYLERASQFVKNRLKF